MVDMIDTDTQRIVAREFWGDTRRGWSDMTHDERLAALDAHAKRHKRAPAAAPAPVVLPTPPSLAGAPPAIVKLAGDLFGSVRAYVKTLLDSEMGRQHDELRGLSESMERRISTLEALPTPKAADNELIARVNKIGLQLSSFEKRLAAIERRKD
jgi:hypothetical protein